MVEARIMLGAVRPMETSPPSPSPSPSPSATAAKPVRGAVRDPSSLRRRRLSAEIHGVAAAAAVVGVAVVGGKEKGGKSPCLAILVSLHHAYAPFIIVTAVNSLTSSSATNTAERVSRMTARRRRREREMIMSLAIGHRVLRKTNPI